MNIYDIIMSTYTYRYALPAVLGASLYVFLVHFSDEEVWTIDSILYVVLEPSFSHTHTRTQIILLSNVQVWHLVCDGNESCCN